MAGRPERSEAAPYYFTYIDLIESPDIVGTLRSQWDETTPFLLGISEEESLDRYAPDKWSIRQVLNHINDCERLFLFRALWFARGFDTPLPSFDQNVSAAGACADQVPWSRHTQEFLAIRAASVSFFENLPEEAWMRSGIASGNPFTVRALAYIAAGHVTHHRRIIEERYLSSL